MNWPLVPLGDLCELVNGRAFRESDWSSDGLPIIRIQNLNSRRNGFNYWAGATDRQVMVEPGNLLLAWSGTPGTSFGAHIWDGLPGVLNQHIFRVDLITSKIDSRWAARAINDQLNHLIDLAHGGVGLKHVTRGTVENLMIPLPPMEEQRRIAAILDQAEALRAKRRQALAKLDTLTQSIFLEMFGDSKVQAQTKTLGDVCHRIVDGTHKTPTYTNEGIPFVTVKNIASGKLDLRSTKFISEKEHDALTKRTRPEQGDILVSKDGTIGIPCLVDTDEVFSIFVSVALLKLKKDQVDPTFLCAQLGSEEVQKQIRDSSKGIAIRHLHLTDFKRLRLTIPAMEKQHEFRNSLQILKRARADQERNNGVLDTLFFSLQQRAFRGKL